MKLWQKLSAVLLVLVLTVAALTACDETPNGPADTTGDPTDSVTDSGDQGGNDENPGSLTLAKDENGALNFKIIRPQSTTSDTTAVKVAQNIASELSTLFGVTPKLSDDWIQSGTEHDASTVEILVGATNYDETKAALEGIGYGDYAVKMVGHKIVVFSYSDNYLLAAGNELVKAIKNAYDETTGEATVTAEAVAMQKTRDDQLSALPVYEGGKFKAYYNAGENLGNDDCYEIIVSGTTAAEFGEYKNTLAANGYTKYTETSIGDNLFATYTNSQYTVTAGYYNYETSARLLIEPLAPAVGLESDNSYTKVTTSQITMIGLEYTDSNKNVKSNGQSFLIRLTDGRFIVIDGGFNNSSITTKFVNIIKDQAKAYTTKPVIAAWIITHGHGDHTGLIRNYASIKGKGISCERILANFMSQTERERSVALAKKNSGWDDWSSTSGYSDDIIRNAAKGFGATLYKVHVGQVFYLADLKLEVLYTLESYAPNGCNAFNTTSLVMKMTFDGKTTYLSTGDATGQAFNVCTKMYGDYLQCDIVQTAHHGYTTWGNNAGTMAAYRVINAEIVLWPQGLTAYPNYKGKDYNAVLFTLSNYKDVYVAGANGDLIIVELPYEYGKSNITVSRVNGQTNKS